MEVRTFIEEGILISNGIFERDLLFALWSEASLCAVVEDLPDDPIEAVFALNEEMASRVPRIGAIVDFAYFASLIFVAIFAVGTLVFWLLDFELYVRILWAFALAVTPVMIWMAYKERQFLSEYGVLARAVNRAKDWEPEPEIPEGEEPLDRLIEYLKGQDERFAYLYEKRPHCLKTPYKAWGLREGDQYYYDAYFNCRPYPWHRMPEGLRLFIKILPLVDVSDAQQLLDETNAMLKEPPTVGLPVRVILLQTESGDLSDDVIEFVEETWFEYQRTVGREEWEWTSPIELMAEDPEGHYNIFTLHW